MAGDCSRFFIATMANSTAFVGLPNSPPLFWFLPRSEIDDWRLVSCAVSSEFEEEPERVAYLMRSLYRAGLAIEHAEHLGRARLRPPEADEFHMVLVGQVLAMLAAEGDAHLHFVAGLREEWGVAASHVQTTHG